MATLTIFCKDQTKQVVNCKQSVLIDRYGNREHPQKLSKKISEIAQTIAGYNYFSHKFRDN